MYYKIISFWNMLKFQIAENRSNPDLYWQQLWEINQKLSTVVQRECRQTVLLLIPQNMLQRLTEVMQGQITLNNKKIKTQNTD